MTDTLALNVKSAWLDCGPVDEDEADPSFLSSYLGSRLLACKPSFSSTFSSPHPLHPPDALPLPDPIHLR